MVNRVKRVHYEDLIIDLYLLNSLDKGGGKKRTAKMLYLLEEDLFQQRIIGPHYVMKRYPMGPYDKRIGNNLENLAKNGYLKHSNRYYANSITSKVIKEIDELIQENSIIFNQFDKIIEDLGNESGDAIAEYIYSLHQIGMKRQSFLDYKEFEVIIDPRKIKNPKFKFSLDESWYETIEILLNPKIFSSLRSGIKDCQIGNFTL